MQATVNVPGKPTRTFILCKEFSWAHTMIPVSNPMSALDIYMALAIHNDDRSSYNTCIDPEASRLVLVSVVPLRPRYVNANSFATGAVSGG